MSAPEPPGAAEPPEAPEPPPPVEASRTEDDTPSTWQPWLYIRLALLGLAIAYLVGFIVQNTDEIRAGVGLLAGALDELRTPPVAV